MPGLLRRLVVRLRKLTGDRAQRSRADAIARKYSAYTMVPRNAFVDNLLLASRIKDVAGCVVECGVWRGGMIAGIAEVLGPQRQYFLFDSFEGLPAATSIDGPAALRWQSDKQSPRYLDNCKAEMAFGERAMEMSGAPRVTIKKGWFNETLPGFEPAEGIALLRLDADWYESTMQCLESLYKHVVPGGMVIIDDYYTWDGCAKAVHDFLSAHTAADRIRQTPAGVCYFIRAAA